jgi:hypothetical protein
MLSSGLTGADQECTGKKQRRNVERTSLDGPNTGLSRVLILI